MPEPVPVPTPRTRFIRPFTTHILNPFTRLFIHRLPGFAIISHRGRKSGEIHRTPMNVFRDGEDYLFALTYGSNVQWVKNVLAAGEADSTDRRQDDPRSTDRSSSSTRSGA